MTDLLIIGAGPAGLSAAAEMTYHEGGSVLVFEKGDAHNQTVHKYYPDDKRVDAAYKGQEAVCAGVLCFSDTTKDNFLKIIDQLLETYAFRIEYNANVDSIKKKADGSFLVSTTDGRNFEAKNVIIATGRMGKPNRPEYFAQIPMPAKKHIHFDVKKIEPEGKRVLVVGGGNSAVEFALSLSKKTNVTLSYRKENFSRLNPMNLCLLEKDEKEGVMKVYRASNIKAIEEKEGKPLVHFEELDSEVFDEVVFGIGGSSPAAFLQNAGIALDAKGMPELKETLETNVEGLYVVGELAVPPGKGSIIASFNSGKKAVDSIMTKAGMERKPEIVTVNR